MTTSVDEQSQNVQLCLQSGSNLWNGVPDYSTFSRAESLQRVDELAAAILGETNAEPSLVRSAQQATSSFYNHTFDTFESSKSVDMERVFLVTRRASSLDADEYASESRYHVPLAVPAFSVSPWIRMRAQIGLPPLIVDTYTASNDRVRRGAVMIAPLYADMLLHLSSREAQKVADENLASSIAFAHRLGARVIGLGALLPQLTRFGTTLSGLENNENRVTTTGHGGTVFLVCETVTRLIDDFGFSGTEIGVLGAGGSIGGATCEYLLSTNPDVHLNVFDVRTDRTALLRARLGSRVDICESVRDVVERCAVTISAITGYIDLDDIELKDGTPIDLADRVIVDDSQPGSFYRQQVEARRGALVWVVGSDGSQDGFLTRDGSLTQGVPYNYGDRAGLFGPASEFGCGLEAGVIAASGADEVAIRGPVTTADVARVGALFREYGVEVAGFQSYGQPVSIERTKQDTPLAVRVG